MFVDPLGIARHPDAVARRRRSARSSAHAQPVREQLFAALLEADCGNATYITIARHRPRRRSAGAGSFGLELGGVQATTAEINGFAARQLPPAPPPALARRPGVDAGPRRVDAAATGDRHARCRDRDAAADTARAGGTADDAVGTADVDGRAGRRSWPSSPAAAARCCSSPAEGDRRKMRRAQRAIPLEA